MCKREIKNDTTIDNVENFRNEISFCNFESRSVCRDVNRDVCEIFGGGRFDNISNIFCSGYSVGNSDKICNVNVKNSSDSVRIFSLSCFINYINLLIDTGADILCFKSKYLTR